MAIDSGVETSPTTIRYSCVAVSIDAVKKALYRLADRGSYELGVDSDEIIIRVFPAASVDSYALAAQIRNEILDQELREIVAAETTDQRTLILANAFSKTTLIE